jgi:hypothetical protein
MVLWCKSVHATFYTLHLHHASLITLNLHELVSSRSPALPSTLGSCDRPHSCTSGLATPSSTSLRAADVWRARLVSASAALANTRVARTRLQSCTRQPTAPSLMILSLLPSSRAIFRRACAALPVLCMVYGVWCMVYGVWCMVYSVWCMLLVHAVCCMAYTA